MDLNTAHRNPQKNALSAAKSFCGTWQPAEVLSFHGAYAYLSSMPGLQNSWTDGIKLNCCNIGIYKPTHEVRFVQNHG